MVGDILKQILKWLQKLGLLFCYDKGDTLLSVVHQRHQRQCKTVTHLCRAQQLLCIVSVVMVKAFLMLLTNYVYMSCMILRINS